MLNLDHRRTGPINLVNDADRLRWSPLGDLAGLMNRTATWQEVLSGHDAEGVGIRWAVELESQGTAYLR